MRIAIIGGGINGLSCAWVLAQQGHEVSLFERGRLMEQTSRTSTKLLHGGLRYLEHGQIRLVREALRERDAWLSRVPSLARPINITIPIYGEARRSRWKYRAGLFLYKGLAGRSRYSNYSWRTAAQLLDGDPDLRSAGLLGGFTFTDGQMDDYALGLWVAQRARQAGAMISEGVEIAKVTIHGDVTSRDGLTNRYDRVVNVAGPWAEHLCNLSGTACTNGLDLVRGSHLIIDSPCVQAYLLEVPSDGRLFFLLPWKGRTLVGTTEVRQELDEPITCSAEEKRYLMAAHNAYRANKVGEEAIVAAFSGLRPLVRSAHSPSRASRDYALQRSERLLTVLGGKWTTSLALARRVSAKLN